jgi:D-galactonate transporter
MSATMTTQFGAAPLHSKDAIDATLKKVAWRLIPFLFFCYVLNFIDRINVGYSQLQMKQELGFTDAVYGLGAGLFFIGYFTFEVPSNLMLEKIGARKTILRIMLLWGLTSAATMFVVTPVQYYVARSFLGVFEAGFFPGIMLYLTYWFPAGHRARIVALFMTAVVIAGLAAGPISGWILKDMNGVHGLQGWQWMFLLEGLPSALFGIVLYLYLDDRPKDAKWLTPVEKEIVIHNLEADKKVADVSRHNRLGQTFSDPKIFLLAFVHFAITCGGFVISFWMPTIIRELGVTDLLQIGLYATIPYGIAAIAMVLWARHSDAKLERRWHFAAPALIGALALGLTTVISGNFWVSMLLLMVATAGLVAPLPIFWAISTAYLSQTAAAAGIAIITSIGNLSGFVSPYVIGSIKTSTGSTTIGIYLMTAVVVAGVLSLLVGVPPRMVHEREEN